MITANEARIGLEVQDLDVKKTLKQIEADILKVRNSQTCLVYEFPYNPKAMREISSVLKENGYMVVSQGLGKFKNAKPIMDMFIDWQRQNPE